MTAIPFFFLSASFWEIRHQNRYDKRYKKKEVSQVQSRKQDANMYVQETISCQCLSMWTLIRDWIRIIKEGEGYKSGFTVIFWGTRGEMLPHHEFILEIYFVLIYVSTSEASHESLFSFCPFIYLLKCVYTIILHQLCLCRAALLKCWEGCTIIARQAINVYKPLSQDSSQNGTTCFCLLLDASC